MRRPDYADQGGEAARMSQHRCDCDDCPCSCHSYTPPSSWCRPEWIPVTQADLRRVHDAIHALERALSREFTKLERYMSALDDALAALDVATNEVAAKLAANTAQIADLAAQLAAALPGSAEAVALQAQIDAAVASINAESDRLVGLAADPANPVPAPVEAPPVA